MKNYNLNLLFNTRYFNDKDLDLLSIVKNRDSKNFADYFKKANEIILGRRLNDSVDGNQYRDQLKSLHNNSLRSINLKVLYPGLLVGSGYSHEIKYLGEVKLGFSFDYTAGLPYIPGSSVKGVLRSVFPDWGNQRKIKITAKSIKIKEAQTAFLYSFLRGGSIKNAGKDKNVQDLINKIENEIFNGVIGDQNLSIYDRDIFFDANIEYSGTKNLLTQDTITPHFRKDIDPKDVILKEPIPLMFFKVAPDNKFVFNFFCKDHTNLDPELLNPDMKIRLFKHILKTVGVGAKTNIGYGQLGE